MSIFPSKFACRTRTFFTEFRPLHYSDVFGAPVSSYQSLMSTARDAQDAIDLEPKPTQTTHIDVSLAKANSLKLCAFDNSQSRMLSEGSGVKAFNVG